MNICKICGKEISLGEAFSFKDGTLDCYHKECRIMNCSDDKPWTYFPIMKEFNIPYIEEVWLRQMITNIKIAINTHSYKSMFGRYLSVMKLKGYKSFEFEDSQECNYYCSNAKNDILRDVLLDREIPQEYFDIIYNGDK